VGLPAGVTSESRTLAPDQSELRFPLLAAPDARPGRFPSVLCRLTTMRGTEAIVQTLGTGQIRVDPAPSTSTPPPA
ncbi:MAG TPA: hypothetical protein VIY86_09530, partial [Pirellulaceae bacterium]